MIIQLQPDSEVSYRLSSWIHMTAIDVSITERHTGFRVVLTLINRLAGENDCTLFFR